MRVNVKLRCLLSRDPAGSRNEIVHRVAIEERTHARYISATHRRHTFAHGIFVHRIYERGFRSEDKQPSSVCPAETIFSPPTRLWKVARDVYLSTLLSAVCLFRSGNSMSHSRTRDFTNDTDTLSARARLRCLSEEEARK